ncbi:MAG TPA: galactokinase [Anaerolineae bacterium]|nr:galactokinase [Anaerolineae bacterium]
MTSILQKSSEAFQQRFGAVSSLIVRAPGRVNLIGEHTDYNDGFVLPMAIDRAVWIALRPRDDDAIKVHSLDFDQSAAFSLGLLRHESAGWVEYLKGVAWALQEAGYVLKGWEGVVTGDVPLGAGLSSSAALELAAARAFAAVSDLPWEAETMARLCQRAENRWVGVNCGIMDQMISASGKDGHALLIDCRSLETKAVPLPPETAVVVLDTATRRGLVDSAYNERRAQCEAAAHHFRVKALRDVDLERFEAQSVGLDEVTYRRARHVVAENDRTLLAVETMYNEDAVQLGKLMNASHASLRDDFQVSSSELDTMVSCALNEQGCYGARMTGAGFGGCVVALIEVETSLAFSARVAANYEAATGITPGVYVCSAVEGAQLVAPI